MKLITEYYSIDEKCVAKVYFTNDNKYCVVYNDEFGNTYNATFDTLRIAENYAEDRVLK